MNGERKNRKKGGVGLWVILAIAVVNIVDAVGGLYLFLLVGVASVAFVVWFIKRRVAAGRSDEPEDLSPGARPSAWQQVRNEQARRFEEQRERQEGTTGRALAGGSGRIYTNPLGRIHHEEVMRIREELVDLLNAGIIDKAEFNERMAAVMKGE